MLMANPGMYLTNPMSAAAELAKMPDSYLKQLMQNPQAGWQGPVIMSIMKQRAQERQAATAAQNPPPKTTMAEETLQGLDAANDAIVKQAVIERQREHMPKGLQSLALDRIQQAMAQQQQAVNPQAAIQPQINPARGANPTAQPSAPIKMAGGGLVSFAGGGAPGGYDYSDYYTGGRYSNPQAEAVNVADKQASFADLIGKIVDPFLGRSNKTQAEILAPASPTQPAQPPAFRGQLSNQDVNTRGSALPAGLPAAAPQAAAAVKAYTGGGGKTAPDADDAYLKDLIEKLKSSYDEGGKKPDAKKMIEELRGLMPKDSFKETEKAIEDSKGELEEQKKDSKTQLLLSMASTLLASPDRTGGIMGGLANLGIAGERGGQLYTQLQQQIRQSQDKLNSLVAQHETAVYNKESGIVTAGLQRAIQEEHYKLQSQQNALTNLREIYSTKIKEKGDTARTKMMAAAYASRAENSGLGLDLRNQQAMEVEYQKAIAAGATDPVTGKPLTRQQWMAQHAMFAGLGRPGVLRGQQDQRELSPLLI
jgi:hypothetical protein